MLAGSDSHAHKKEVKTGIHDGDQVQILEGLQATDHIVGTGAYGLPDNSKITAEAKPEKEGSDAKE